MHRIASHRIILLLLVIFLLPVSALANVNKQADNVEFAAENLPPDDVQSPCRAIYYFRESDDCIEVSVVLHCGNFFDPQIYICSGTLCGYDNGMTYSFYCY